MNFVDLLRTHRVPFQTEGKYCRPGWVQFKCPFCSGGTDPDKPYAGFNLAFSYVHCWRCGPHNLTKTITELMNLTWKEASALTEGLETQRIQPKEKHSGKLVLPKGRDELAPAHRKYLKKRGYDIAEIERLWRVEGIGIASHLAWRIFIPIYYHGEIVSWTTRSLIDEGLRYISASLQEESTPHKTLLYGEDYATNAISIHEGPFDVWKVGPGAVATLGTSFTPAQVLKMSRYPRRIVCFDSEPAAQARAETLCRLLEGFPGETLKVVLDSKDAGCADEKELREIRKMLR